MANTERLEKTCTGLKAKYGDTGERASGALRRWMSGDVPFAYAEMLEQHLGDERLALLFDAFW